MSSNSSAGDFFGNGNSAGYTYGISVSAGIVILISTVTLASYFCARSDAQSAPQGQAGQQSDQHFAAVDIGIDEETLHGYPKLVYSEANSWKKEWSAACCSICLGDYRKGEELRVLPDCRHVFHLRCVDPWLRLHATCPVCRSSPLAGLS